MKTEKLILNYQRRGIKLSVSDNKLHFSAPQNILTDEDKDILKKNKKEVIKFLLDHTESEIIVDEEDKYEKFPLTDIQLSYLVGQDNVYKFGGTNCKIYTEIEYEQIELNKAQYAWEQVIKYNDMLHAVINQEALNRAENNKIANKILIFSSSEESTNLALKKIKELKIDWSKYSIEKDTNAFEESLESVSGIKHIIKIMTYSIMLGGIVVLSLILILWLRERIYEIGILLSIGISKIKIVIQFILELIFISLPSIISTLVLGNLLLRQILDGFIRSDNSMIVSNSLLNNSNSILNLGTLIQSYFILISIIILSVIVASSMILVKKPKEILSKIS